MTEIETYCPRNPSDWREWLKLKHQDKDSIWLIIYKKNSKNPNITWSDAVDQALCFGWIDSVRRPIDQEKYMQYFGKRKPSSTWSKINKDKVDDLLAKGLIAKAGIECIEVAKKNGNWTLLDDVERLLIPEELESAFAMHPGTKDFFLGLTKSAKKRILYWIVIAKRKETREKRIHEIILNAVKKQLPKALR